MSHLTNVGGGVGQATVSTNSLSAATHNICAVYAGDNSYLAGTSNTLQQTVSAIVTTLALSTNPATDPTSYGQIAALQLSATLSGPGAGNAGGTVHFYVDGSQVGTDSFGNFQNANSSTWTFTLNTTLNAGPPHPMYAQFVPSNNSTFAGSTSPTITRTVNATNPTIVLTASPAGNSVHGQTITFTATMTPNYATGTVGFYECPTAVNNCASPTLRGTGTITKGLPLWASRSMRLAAPTTCTPSTRRRVDSTLLRIATL